MNRSSHMKGLKELQTYLSALPKNMQRNAAAQGLRAAAAVIRDEAKQRVAKRTGKLAKSIRSTNVDRNKDGNLSIRVELSERKGSSGFIGWFLEYGVRPHFIRVSDEVLNSVNASLRPLKNGKQRTRRTLVRHVNKRARAGTLVIGDKPVGREVYHPGIRPQPFLVPALDTKADEAVQAFAAKIRAYLEGVKEATGYDVVGAVDGDLEVDSRGLRYARS